MSHPEDWFRQQAHNLKSLVAPDPEEARIKSEAKTEEAERSSRRRNYLDNPKSKYRPTAGHVIKAKPSARTTSGRIKLR